MDKVDVIIIGAGAAGLMCAIEAGKRGRSVIVLESANKPGKKILMSGGGRCNFTNLDVTPDNFISHNPHFCKSALSRYTPQDFITLVEQQDIPFHEKTLGQLFCDNKSKDILNMLLLHCDEAGVDIRLDTKVEKIDKLNDRDFKLKTNIGEFGCESLVIASGGLSIPTMGASPFGYKIAEQFGIKVWPTRAGLVPFTLNTADKDQYSPLSGVSADSTVSSERKTFNENILFTHRGLSGPAILQISSYWKSGEEILINLLPKIDLVEYLKAEQKNQHGQQLKTVISKLLPKRVVETFIDDETLQKKIQTISHDEFESISKKLNEWKLKPNGTEGYRTAEVTLGGVDCDAISSKTMEAVR